MFWFNLFSFILGGLCMLWVFRRFPEMPKPIVKMEFMPIVGMTIYLLICFVSPTMSITLAIIVIIIEVVDRKGLIPKNDDNKKK